MLAAGLALACAGLIGTIGAPVMAAFGASTASAPRIVAVVIAGISAVSLLVLASPLASLILRDFETGMAQLVFASPVNPRHYLAGRMLAGFIVSLAVMAVVSLGALAGLALAGDLHFGTAVYGLLWAFGWVVLPNAFFMVATVVALASRTRKIGWVYAGIMVFYVLWIIALVPLPGVTAETQALATAILDPFGSRVLSDLPVLLEGGVDTQLPGLSRNFLLNRGLWLLISAFFAGWSISSFRVSRPASRARAPMCPPAHGDRETPNAPAHDPSPGRRSALLQFQVFVVTGLRWIVRSAIFRVMLGLSVLLLLGISCQAGGMYGTQSQWTMARLLQALAETVRLPLTFMLAVFAGGLVFRAKEARMAGIEDSLPVSPTCRLLSDDLSLLLVVLLVHAVLLVVAMGLQGINAAAAIEPRIYAEWLVRSAMSFALLALVARAVFGLCPHRAVGFALFAGITIIARVAATRYPDFEWLAFAAPPVEGYSDLSGFFVSTGTWLEIALSWGAAVAALQATVILTTRSPPGARVRRRLVPSWIAHPFPALIVIAGIAGALAGGVPLWQASRAHFAEHSLESRSDRAARYGHAYARYANAPGLRVRGVRAEVDFYPSQGRAEIRGTYSLVNTQSLPIDTLYVNFEPDDAPTLAPAQAYRTILNDSELGFRIVQLDKPVPPGAAIEVAFTARILANDDDPTGTVPVITADGAMFTNLEHFPQFGYLRRRAVAPRSAPAAVLPASPTPDTANSQLEGDADWIDFSATVSTDRDQTALAPGVLEREWRIGQRHYFQYRMRSQMLPYIAFASGRYTVARSAAAGIPIEMFYDTRHRENVALAVAAARDSLNLFAGKLGAYPFGVLRLVEVAGTLDAAETFPGMVMLSESSEFTRDMDSGQRHSLQFMVAHEVAHEWFGNQMIGADAAGAAMLTESVAQYLGLLELERIAGLQVALQAVRWDLHEYLSARPRAPGLERALSRESGEAYLYYHKGAVAFWLLGRELGEPVVNEVLARFFAAYRFKPAPYPMAAELVSRLRAVASEAERPRVEELLSGVAESERYQRDRRGVAPERDEPQRYDLELAGHEQKAALAADVRLKGTPQPPR